MKSELNPLSKKVIFLAVHDVWVQGTFQYYFITQFYQNYL